MPTRIEWCDETINPLGHWCFGPGGTEELPQPCPYCYARTMAQRGMRGCEKCQRFEKHTHFEQLAKLSQWKKPRTVFIQSMGDLFHPEVPDDWRYKVLQACYDAPQHRYLCLTKNPAAYRKVNEWREEKHDSMPVGGRGPLMLLGASVTDNDSQWEAYDSEAVWCSIEPILAPVSTEFFIKRSENSPEIEQKRWEWVVLGAETGHRQGKVIPVHSWLWHVAETCSYWEIPLFMKPSLQPFWPGPLIQQFPPTLKA